MRRINICKLIFQTLAKQPALFHRKLSPTGPLLEEEEEEEGRRQQETCAIYARGGWKFKQVSGVRERVRALAEFPLPKMQFWQKFSNKFLVAILFGKLPSITNTREVTDAASRYTDGRISLRQSLHLSAKLSSKPTRRSTSISKALTKMGAAGMRFINERSARALFFAHCKNSALDFLRIISLWANASDTVKTERSMAAAVIGMRNKIREGEKQTTIEKRCFFVCRRSSRVRRRRNQLNRPVARRN